MLNIRSKLSKQRHWGPSLRLRAAQHFGDGKGGFGGTGFGQHSFTSSIVMLHTDMFRASTPPLLLPLKPNSGTNNNTTKTSFLVAIYLQHTC
ncbi:hypothetical protein Scep_010766 [Stephania cephalantha]|uniref:Uncharacterized protein n=1 Tax=Stephania cephalantha TaxID=152367 RepID=A0AAP0PHC8_9MAGN